MKVVFLSLQLSHVTFYFRGFCFYSLKAGAFGVCLALVVCESCVTFLIEKWVFSLGEALDSGSC